MRGPSGARSISPGRRRQRREGVRGPSAACRRPASAAALKPRSRRPCRDRRTGHRIAAVQRRDRRRRARAAAAANPCGAQFATGAGPRSSSGTDTPTASAPALRPRRRRRRQRRDRAVQPAAGHPLIGAAFQVVLRLEMAAHAVRAGDGVDQQRLVGLIHRVQRRPAPDAGRRSRRGPAAPSGWPGGGGTISPRSAARPGRRTAPPPPSRPARRAG